jgi:trehalose 6-phosphate synthase
MWNKDSLEDLVQKKFGEYQFILVSNREPFMHVYRDGEVEVITPASGMAIALDSVMRTTGGTWVAAGSGEADQDPLVGRDSIMVPLQNPKYKLRRLWLTREEEKGYYYGFSNEALWPLCHVCYARPYFDSAQWEIYRRVNRKFVDVILSEVGDKRTIVFIQDYHFALLPQMLQEADPRLIVCQFWHIPWPSFEVFRICPWGTEILEGLLGNSLLGFHLQYDCNNFFETVERSLEARVDYENFSIIRQNKETRVRSFPISIDFERFENLAASEDTEAQIALLRHRHNLNGLKVGLGVDRLDYIKGIPERLEGINIFFQKYPQYQGRFTFIQLGPISRLNIPQYKQLNAQVDSLEVEINSRYGWGRWKPLIVVKAHLSQEKIAPYYCLADIMVVSSLHDGMNLVAKEYVASRVNNDGALLLSPFTGAARELGSAYSINPFNSEDIADNIYKALEEPPEEKAVRMVSMRHWVREHNIYLWAGRILEDLIKGIGQE